MFAVRALHSLDARTTGKEAVVNWASGLSASGCVAALLVAGCDNTTEPSEPHHLEAITPTTLYGRVGAQVTPVPGVRLTNSAGDPVRGVFVLFIVTGGGNVVNRSARTDRDGRATVGGWWLGPVAGSEQKVTAVFEQVPNVVFSAAALPGPVAQLARVGGDNQVALAGDTLPNVLRVKVTDAFGNRLSSVLVKFVVLSGNGSIHEDAETDTAGIAASGPWTLGPEIGAQQVRAEVDDKQVVFTAQACDEACRKAELVFVRNGQIFRSDLLGINARQLTSDNSGREITPAWSPDGRRIAFARDLPAPSGIYRDGAQLYVMDANGSNVVRRAVGFHSPAWSPDGRRLAVTSRDCIYECDLYVMSVDDDGRLPVLVADMAAEPAWSPDGKKIAFVSLSGDDGYHALHVMNADGSDITPITVRDEGGIYRPTWSPDGRRIAFSKCQNGACNIFVVNADGSALTPLTTFGNAATVGNPFGPAWSPDGTRIAFTLYRFQPGVPERSVAYVAVETGGDPVPIVSPGDTPAWRPDVGNQEPGIRNRE